MWSFIPFIQKAFGSVTKDLGLLAVLLGIGLFLGSLAFGSWGGKVAKWKVIFWSLIFRRPCGHAFCRQRAGDA